MLSIENLFVDVSNIFDIATVQLFFKILYVIYKACYHEDIIYPCLRELK
jgi:hypothetical protein